MDGAMIHFYEFKKLIDSIPNEIKKHFEYNDNKLFNYSTFNDNGIFYKQFNPFKKDKYKLYNAFHSDKFYEFIVEYTISLKAKFDFDKLLFLYAIYHHIVLDNYLKAYLAPRTNKRFTYDDAINLLDWYYTLTKYKIDILKNPIGLLYYESFYYTYELDSYIKDTTARVFGFFNTDIYFLKCINRKKFFYTYIAIPSRFKKIIYLIWSLFTHNKDKKKPKTFLIRYKNSITPLLNESKKPYISGNETYCYSFNDVLDAASKKALEGIKAINDYIFYNKDKEFRHIFNIDKNKQL